MSRHSKRHRDQRRRRRVFLAKALAYAFVHECKQHPEEREPGRDVIIKLSTLSEQEAHTANVATLTKLFKKHSKRLTTVVSFSRLRVGLYYSRNTLILKQSPTPLTCYLSDKSLQRVYSLLEDYAHYTIIAGRAS